MRRGETKAIESIAWRTCFARSAVLAAPTTRARDRPTRIPSSADTSTVTGTPALTGAVCAICRDDAPHEAMAHDIRLVEIVKRDPLDALENPLHLRETRLFVLGQIDLCLVSGDHDLRVHSESCEEHLHLHLRRILGLIEDDERVPDRSPAHE